MTDAPPDMSEYEAIANVIQLYIDVAETIAAVRLELDNWTGIRFSDMFTLLKIDGEWKIINKVFHQHDQ